MSDDKELQREKTKGEQAVFQKIQRETEKLKRDEIQNSITHLEISLEKFLYEHKPADLENVYWHIGAINGALK